MKKKRIIIEILLFLCVFFLLSCGKEEEILIEQPPESAEEAIVSEKTVLEEEMKKSIWVDVCGAVNCPGVYELEENSRVFEAVKAAGGFAENADKEWINQAAVVKDGAKIQVYTAEETAEMKEQGIHAEDMEESQEERDKVSKVNLNTASLEQLQEIPGIGEIRAQAILDYREEKGKFQNIEEIQGVPGIKGKTFEKIEEYITVE